jgi:serine/threonine protein kinase
MALPPPGYIPLVEGTLLREYEILGVIGIGGMGAVYKARHSYLEQYRAIKETWRSDSESSEAFIKEAKMLSDLRHDGLPQVHEFFMEEVDFGVPGKSRFGHFLVMEYVAGNNLEWLRNQGSSFNLEAVMVWTDQILTTLTYLHSRPKPIVHKDIKPSNLKLGEDNRVVLLDFGLSKNMEDGTFLYGNSKHYSSLEQCQNVSTDPRSDLYSIGATLCYLLVGLPPPDAVDRELAVRQGKSDPLHAFLATNKQVIPSLVSQQLAKAMALNREARHATAQMFREELKRSWMNQTSEITLVQPETVPTLVQLRKPLDRLEEKDDQTLYKPTIAMFRRKLEARGDAINCISFSPANGVLASASEDGSIGIWNMESFDCQMIPKSPRVGITALAFSPSGDTLACSRLNNIVELWDANSQELKWRFPVSGLEVHSLTFSPDGKMLAAGDLGRPPASVTLWEVNTLQVLRRLDGTGHFLIKSLSFAPSGKFLVGALWSRNTQTTSDQQGQVVMWELTNDSRRILVNNLRVNRVEFSPCENIIALGCVDTTVKLLDVANGSQLRTITGHQNSVTSLAFHPTGGVIASGDFGQSLDARGCVRLSSAVTGSSLNAFESQPRGVRTLSFSKDGECLAFSDGRHICIYELSL